MSETAAESAVNAALDVIQESIVNGDKVQLVGFGSFFAKERSGRSGRDFNGNQVSIPAKRVPSFKAGSALSDAVNNVKR
jgi:DNA-binding protein HU-beta